MLLTTTKAQAYICHGRWISDCVRQDCRNAEKLTPRQSVFHCTNCQQVAPVEWPDDPDDIWDALAVRPVPQTRNWAPAGHRQTYASRVRDGRLVADVYPHGETVADLIDEGHR